MKASRCWCALLLAVALCSAVAAPRAQESQKEKPAAQPFTVLLSALVTDSQDRPVGDVRQEDFQIKEDGVPQTVTHFEKLEGPHAFGLVVDRSGSMRTDIGRVVAFGRLVVNGAGADAAGFVLGFVSSDNIKVFQDTTTNKRALSAALDDIFIEGGQTAINDAVYLAAERLAQYKQITKSPRRYSLVLVTDGEDRASYYKDAQVFEKLRETGVRLFVIGLVQKEYGSPMMTPEKAMRYMRRLAFESGGSAYFFKRGDELTQVAEHVLADMNANYLVGYESTNTKRDGSTRKVAASVGAGGEARKVFTRDSYVAPKK